MGLIGISPHLTCSDAFYFNTEKPDSQKEMGGGGAAVPGFRLRSTSAGSAPARCQAEQGPTSTPTPQLL